MKLNIDQTLQQGVAAHNTGDLQKAERAYRAILHSQPKHPDANHNLGLIATSTNKLDVALSLFKTALTVNPNIEQFWISYIDALVKNKQLKDAKQAIKKAAKQGFSAKKLQALLSQANDAEFHNALGIALKEQGKLEEAAASLTRAIALKPDFTEAHGNLGNTLQEMGRLDSAVACYEQVLALKPDSAEAYSNLGYTLQELGRLEEARTNCVKAITLKANFAAAHNNLGNALKGLGELDEAKASYRQAIALESGYAEAHYNLGVILQELGRLKEAEASYKKALAIKTVYVEALHNLSIVYNYMNDSEAEIFSLRNIGQIDPDNYGLIADVNLAICNFLDGNFEDSRKHIVSAIRIQEKTSLFYKNEKVYWGYLSKILDWHHRKDLVSKNEKSDKILYVLGESHCLSSHNLRIKNSGIDFFCMARLIKGCKQWHLGNASMNQYKHLFEGIFHALPKHSYVLLAIGEIDCRIDTGIIAHKRKFPEKQVRKIILNTIRNYLDYIVKNNSACQHNVIIQGVPCQNLDVRNYSDKDIGQLDEIIKIFNYELEMQSKKKGFSFLDTYQLTNNDDGLCNGHWHIDDHHLSPQGILEAWRRYGSEQSYEQL